MLPLVALSLVSCEKDNEGNGEELSGDDPNFLKALLTEPSDTSFHYVDANRDRQITVKEARVIKKLDISDANINDMSEIKYFTTLEVLSCSNNNLTSLDLSSNTLLTYLWCYNNQLTSLDVSKCTVLEELECDNNQLTSLDVSKNTVLSALYCPNNQLTSLDLSRNTELGDLDCSSNQFTSLDVSRCVALTQLWCNNNQLTSLDLSNNKALTRLECSDNPLQELILYKYHIVDDSYIGEIEKEYGDIIEYVE